MRVTKIEDGEVKPAAKPGTPDAASMLGQLLGRHSYDAVLNDMESRAKVERKAAPAR